MNKCKHERVHIIEKSTVFIIHHRNIDGSWHQTEAGEHGTTVEVYCPDCYLDRSYRTKKPKWLHGLLDEMHIALDASYTMAISS